MPSYTAPLDEMRFVLHDVLGAGDLARLPGYEDATPDLIDQILEEAAKIAEQVLQPLNQSGDREGCRLENGVVRTPVGFREAYEAFVDGGWPGLACDPDHGGQGLPGLVGLAVDEMVCSANLSFSTYPGLTHGAYAALARHGTEGQKATYLPRLAAGIWSGTMCLTEPQCGTDLGLIRTRAEPLDTDESGQQTYAITGTKIFISAGEHDLTENIVHLVLARLPDAPAGVKGISLFVVPKFLPRFSDGEPRPGGRNGVSCSSLEHKMGIRASATCVMNFDGASGTLVGELHRGMRAMFVMMNAARLAVGVQGLGISEVSYQNARDYARERLQGRAVTGPRHPDKPADPIIVHADVRRNLLTMKALNEGGRALAYWVARQLDISVRTPDPAERQAADEFVALLTPVVKAFLTDRGTESALAGMQVLGGHGYIQDWGLEQFVRDGRITQIYEGANGIQALDLVGRKLPRKMGRLLRRFFHPVESDLGALADRPDLADLVGPLAKAFGRLQRASATIAQRSLADPREGAAAASDYLHLFGLVAVGYMWLRMAVAATAKLETGGGEEAFCRAKLDTAHFYMSKTLAENSALFARIMAGAGPLMALDEEAF